METFDRVIQTPAYFRMTGRGRRRNDRLVWVKCATSAECKSIRIAASAVMDGWKGHTGRMGKEFVFKRKVFRWSKEVPGRYEFG